MSKKGKRDAADVITDYRLDVISVVVSIVLLVCALLSQTLVKTMHFSARL